PRHARRRVARARAQERRDHRGARRSACADRRSREARRRGRVPRRGIDHDLGQRHGSRAEGQGACAMTAAMDTLPKVRGTYTEKAPLKDLVWFRAGGAADILFRPADVEDLCAFMAEKPADLPVSVIGVGSNLLIRDGGIPGVVIRLPSAFGRIEPVGKTQLKAGAAALDAAVARAAADAGIEGMEFLRGVPGTIGGALTMNAGCYGRELKDIFVEAHAVDSRGRVLTFGPSDMGFTYRHSKPEGVVYVDVLLQGAPGVPETIRERMNALVEQRESTQPVKAKTGGSTFTNPPGHKAWQL